MKATNLKRGLLAMTLWWAGCGSGENASSSGAFAGGPVADRQGGVYGRVQLGAPGSFAQVQAFTLDGQPLLSTQAGPLGDFVMHGSLPRNFRVVARLDNEIFAAEVRNYNGSACHVTINVPSSLVSLAAGGSQDLGEAEAKVRRLLDLPAGTSLDSGIEESGRSRFSHLRFFYEASRNGGSASFAQQLLGQNQPHPFLLDRGTMGLSFSISPGINRVLDQIRGDAFLRLSVLSKAAQSSPRGSGAIAPKSLVAEAASFVGLGVASSAVSSLTAAGWTWMAEALGLNYGTGVELDQIMATLSEIQSSLALLNQTVVEDNFKSDVDKVNVITDGLDILVGANLSAATAAGYNTSTNTGITVDNQCVDPLASSSQSTFLGKVTSYIASSDLQGLQDYALGLNGNTNLITESFALGAPEIGMDQPARFGGFPVRSNAILDNFLQYANRLDGYQTLALNYLGENAHTGTSGVANQINAAVANITSAQALQARARQQAPPFLVSENILVDLENGLMWYTAAQDEMTWDDANAWPQSMSFEVDGVTYDNWRLPSSGELQSLQYRGRFVLEKLKKKYPDTPANSDTGEGDTGTALRGLSALGFKGLDAKKDDGTPVFDTKGSMWMNDWNYFFDPSKNGIVWESGPYREFRLNLENDFRNVEDSTKRRPFLMCRQIGKVPIVAINTEQGYALTPPPDWGVEDVQQTEFPSLGVVTGLGPASFNTSATNSSLDLDITYRVNLGGDFAYTQGQGEPGKTIKSSQSKFYDMTIAQSNIVVDVVKNRDVSAHPSYESSNPAFRLFNSPNNQGGYLLTNSNPNAQPVTANVTAIYIGGYLPATDLFPFVLSSTASLTATAPPRQLTSIQILPRNRLYSFPGGGNEQTDLYQVIAFYSDQTVSDVTQTCTLNITDSAPTPTVLPSQEAEFVNANPVKQLNLHKQELKAANHSQLRVNAAYSGLTDQTNVEASF